MVSSIPTVTLTLSAPTLQNGHTQTIRRQKSTNCLSVFDHFVRLAHKGLSKKNAVRSFQFNSGARYEKKILLKIGREVFIVLFPRSPLPSPLSQKYFTSLLYLIFASARSIKDIQSQAI